MKFQPSDRSFSGLDSPRFGLGPEPARTEPDTVAHLLPGELTRVPVLREVCMYVAPGSARAGTEPRPSQSETELE